MLKIIKFVALLLPFSLFAAFTIDDKPSLTSTELSSEKILYLENHDGISEKGAHILYVPFKLSTDTGVAAANHLFQELPLFDNTLFLHLKGINNVNPNNRYLYIAYKNNSQQYEVLAASPSINGNFVDIPIANLLSSGNFTYNPTSTKFNFYAYVFLNPTVLTKGAIIDPTDANNKEGVYFQFSFATIDSTTTAAPAPTIPFINPGDGQLSVNFSLNGLSDFIISNQFNYISFLYDSTTTPHPNSSNTSYQNVLTYSPQIKVVPIPTGISAININNLINNQTYNVAFAVLNKYNFVSYISNAVSGTPMEIELFLKEKGCFLLSAGFKKEHYVLEYFRNFRDNTLLKSELGTKFVRWYYQVAPYYAQIIYHNETLSQITRFFGYGLYFLFKGFIPLVLLGLFLKKRLITKIE